MLNKVKETIRFNELKALYIKHERFLIPGLLLAGFLSDIIFFAFVTFESAIIALTLHLGVIALSIAIINVYEDNILRGKFLGYLRLAAPLALQFSFGALFSAFVIFYSHSGSLIASWPFIGTMAFLMLANEIFRKYNIRADVQIAVFFFALFSYLNLSLPYLAKTLGTGIFILSGLLSLICIGAFIWALNKYVPRVRRARREIAIAITTIFVAMNVFYFANWIPPIPLSLREIGVYYGVSRAGDEYQLLTREMGIFEKMIRTLTPFYERHLIFGLREAYIYSSIFVPPGMSVDAIHEWQFKDPARGWSTRNRVNFPVFGGRVEGFRAYTKSIIEPGEWRVRVRTKNGQIIGVYKFTVIEVDNPPTYTLEIR